ncbi:MAG: isochorismatase family protein [Methanospirillum sp.]
MRILQIGDMQNGFTREDGNLYVAGAREIIAPANEFLRRVGGAFDLALIVQDTHFAETYGDSAESEAFPLHCEYGTRDWELSVAVPALPNTRYLLKDTYSMWNDGEPASRPNDARQRAAYELLFQVVDDPLAPTERTSRDEFLRAIGLGGDEADVEVAMLGVAADYCVRFAMEGWLARGARVTVLSDLTRGIEKEAEQVLEEERYRAYGDGRLRSVESAEFLRDLARA